MNLANWLVKTAKQHPDKPALFNGSTNCADYNTFAKRAAAIGAYLQHKLHIRKGDRVALFMPNSTAYLEVLYGIWFAGGVVVPINAKLHIKEAVWIVKNAQADVVFTSAKYTAELSVKHVIAVDRDAYSALYNTPALTHPVLVDPDDLVWLFYTSGTTGKPKGVMLSAANIAAMTQAYFTDVDQVSAKDAALYAAPMSHGAGLYNFMHVIRGARHIVPPSGGFDADEILTLAGEMHNLSLFAAPTMVRRLVDCAKIRNATGEGIKTIVYGGGPMYLADIIEAVDVMGPRFVQIFGQGECPMAITVLTRLQVADREHLDWQHRLASVGTAQSVVSVEIRDEAGQQIPNNKIGEICVSGLPVMQGYWRNEDATKATLSDGWLYTGDMGAMDDDGFITLHDRAKDVIISGGSNIYPREVEEVLLQHSDVAEVSVIGEKNSEWGEVVVAFIVAKTTNATELDAFCLANIARFKRPKKYHFVSYLPKNNYGKVLKTKLRDQLHKMQTS